MKLHYLDEGPKQGLPVLLLHGFPLSAESFRPQIAALSPKYRLIVPDHRGFGTSPVGDGPSTMETFADDALGVLNELGIKSAVVGGVSMGGYISMALLRRDAGRVEALVLIDTQPGADDEAAKKGREERARLVEEKGMAVLVEAMLPKLVAPTSSAAVRERVERVIRANPPKGAAAALRGMALRPDSSDILSRFGGPALIVSGEEDAIISPEKARQMKAMMHDAKLALIPGAGHLPNEEAPDRFNPVLAEFLATV